MEWGACGTRAPVGHVRRRVAAVVAVARTGRRCNPSCNPSCSQSWRWGPLCSIHNVNDLRFQASKGFKSPVSWSLVSGIGASKTTP